MLIGLAEQLYSNSELMQPGLSEEAGLTFDSFKECFFEELGESRSLIRNAAARLFGKESAPSAMRPIVEKLMNEFEAGDFSTLYYAIYDVSRDYCFNTIGILASREFDAVETLLKELTKLEKEITSIPSVKEVALLKAQVRKLRNMQLDKTIFNDGVVELGKVEAIVDRAFLSDEISKALVKAEELLADSPCLAETHRLSKKYEEVLVLKAQMSQLSPNWLKLATKQRKLKSNIKRRKHDRLRNLAKPLAEEATITLPKAVIENLIVSTVDQNELLPTEARNKPAAEIQVRLNSARKKWWTNPNVVGAAALGLVVSVAVLSTAPISMPVIAGAALVVGVSIVGAMALYMFGTWCYEKFIRSSNFNKPIVVKPAASVVVNDNAADVLANKSSVSNSLIAPATLKYPSQRRPAAIPNTTESVSYGLGAKPVSPDTLALKTLSQMEVGHSTHPRIAQAFLQNSKELTETARADLGWIYSLGNYY